MPIVNPAGEQVWQSADGRMLTRVSRNGSVSHIHPITGHPTEWHPVNRFHRNQPDAHYRYGADNPAWQRDRAYYRLNPADMTRSLNEGLRFAIESGQMVGLDERGRPVPAYIRQTIRQNRQRAAQVRRSAQTVLNSFGERVPAVTASSARPVPDSTPIPRARPVPPLEPAVRPSQRGVPAAPVAAPDAPFTRGFGVEIEFLGNADALVREMANRGLACAYNGYTHEVMRHWKIVTDGSLSSRRTHEGVTLNGFELVSPPLSGENGMEQLRKACESLVASGARIDRTCGLHVHAEARDMQVADVKRLIVGYTQAQAAIDSFMPPSRREGGNRYCAPHPADVENRLRNCVTILDIVHTLRNRYVNVNLQSYPSYGTIEFRQHSGSLEYSKISAWIRFVFAAFDAAKAARTFGQRLEELLENLSLEAADRSYFVRRAAHFAQLAQSGRVRMNARASWPQVR